MDQVARDIPLLVSWRSFELRPGGGAPDPAKLAAIRAHFPRLQAMAASVGAPMGAFPRMGIDTRPAHQAAKFVEARHPALAKAFHDALYRTHFVAGGDIGAEGTLIALATEVGADGGELAGALAGGDFLGAVLVDEDEARHRRVTGVPFLWVVTPGGERPLAVGYQPPAELREALRPLVAALATTVH